MNEISGEVERMKRENRRKKSNSRLSAERYRPGERDRNAGMWGRTPPKTAFFT